MIKILHVISDTGIGGAGVHLCNLLTCADRSRFDLTVALPEGSALSPRITALDVPVAELHRGADNSADLRAIPELISLIRRVRPHILHTHSALYARIAGRLCRVPVAVNTRHCADMNEHPSWGTRVATKHLEHLLDTHTIATAHYVKDILIKRGVPQKSITVIHNGSIPQASLSTEEKRKLRSNLGIGDSLFTVGMVARLAEGKGHETLLRAARLCLDENPDFCFLIVGDGEKKGMLIQTAQALGIEEQVRFLGFRTDVGRIMNLLDVNVNCSQSSETSSLSLSEGMSVGAVPVVTNCGGNPFMAGFGKNGIVFPVDDARALADAILVLARDRSRLAALSTACRIRFAKEFTAAAMTARTEALYQTLLPPDAIP